MASTSANIGFEKELWEVACTLWGHIPATEYRNVIIGLIFLRYVSCAFAACREKVRKTFTDAHFSEDEVHEEMEFSDNYVAENVFFVPEESRWEYIAKKAHDAAIGSVLDMAMKAIEDRNPSLKGILPKHYANSDLDKQILGDVVDLFSNIDMSGQDDSKDLLGRTYEYCIAKFAEKEGKGGGEFYTPACIVKTLVSILKPFDNCRVYDPCCGSGGMFVQSLQFIKAHANNRVTKDKGLLSSFSDYISVYGQEANPDTWKMAKINLAIRGIQANLGESHADTYTRDLHPTLRADFILANPPFNHKPFPIDRLENDIRFRPREAGGFGRPPAGNANFAWIEHMIYHLAPEGKIGLVLANGALASQTSGEGNIRRAIIEADLIEGIVALPTQLFYSVTIPATLWFISKKKAQPGKTLFIDARGMGHMVDRTHRDFSDEDIQRLSDTFTAFQEGSLSNVPGFCKVATTDEIAEQDFILTPGRYTGVAEDANADDVPFEEKMARLTDELCDLFEKGHELEEQIKKNLKEVGYEV